MHLHPYTLTLQTQIQSFSERATNKVSDFLNSSPAVSSFFCQTIYGSELCETSWQNGPRPNMNCSHSTYQQCCFFSLGELDFSWPDTAQPVLWALTKLSCGRPSTSKGLEAQKMENLERTGVLKEQQREMEDENICNTAVNNSLFNCERLGCQIEMLVIKILSTQFWTNGPA